ncbi:MAG: FecR domain-containing protein [Deltaproteobacteria bacterium]|nr:FecR domain-containing protein [Deltaproteobacteria bacterium]
MKRALFSTMSFMVMVVMVFAFTVVVFGSAGSAEAALSTAGKITEVEGKVAVFRKGKAKGVRAQVGTLIFPGDKIKTFADSNAQLTLRDNSKIIIAPKSTMKMGKFMLSRKTEKRSAFLSILGGKIRIVAQKMYKLTASGKRKLWKSSNFKIKTPTAVVGVKGTDFVITVTMKDGTTYTGVIVLEGLVQAQAVDHLGNLSPAVLISMMQSVEVSEKGVGPKKTLTKAEVTSLLSKIETAEADKEDQIEATKDKYGDLIDSADEEEDEALMQKLEDKKKETIEGFEDTYSGTTMDSFTLTESTTSGGGTSCASDPCIP